MAGVDTGVGRQKGIEPAAPGFVEKAVGTTLSDASQVSAMAMARKSST